LTETEHIYVLHCLFCRIQADQLSPSASAFAATPLPVPADAEEAPWYTDEVVLGGAEEDPGNIADLLLGPMMSKDEKPSRSRVSLAEYKKRRSTVEDGLETQETGYGAAGFEMVKVEQIKQPNRVDPPVQASLKVMACLIN